jgi:hypothetical protein
MTPLRKKILALARKFDGAYMTADQAMMLSSTMGSMDDTLTDDEVWMFLSNIANNIEPTIVISATKPDRRLVKVSVDKNGNVTTSQPPFSQS